MCTAYIVVLISPLPSTYQHLPVQTLPWVFDKIKSDEVRILNYDFLYGKTYNKAKYVLYIQITIYKTTTTDFENVLQGSKTSYMEIYNSHNKLAKNYIYFTILLFYFYIFLDYTMDPPNAHESRVQHIEEVYNKTTWVAASLVHVYFKFWFVWKELNPLKCIRENA